jgi:hypothetical protein
MKAPLTPGYKASPGEKIATEPMPSTIELAETFDLGARSSADGADVSAPIPGPLDVLSAGPPPEDPD